MSDCEYNNRDIAWWIAEAEKQRLRAESAERRLAELENAKQETCKWKWEVAGFWGTSCGGRTFPYTPSKESPTVNDIVLKFCPFCGQKLEVVK